MRFFLIFILIFISTLLLYTSCRDTSEDKNKSFEVFLEQVLEKNTTLSQRNQSVSFAFGEFFEPENYISETQKEQLSFRNTQQNKFFETIAQGLNNSNSTQKTDEDIERTLMREKNSLSKTYNTSGKHNGNTQTQANNNVGGGALNENCAGIIYDPCIILGYDTYPKGIMQFGSWRGKL